MRKNSKQQESRKYSTNCLFSAYFWSTDPFVCSDGPNHTSAIIAAVFLLLLLAVAAVVYSRCHLNIKLWYRNSYGAYEVNGETSEVITFIYNHV